MTYQEKFAELRHAFNASGKSLLEADAKLGNGFVDSNEFQNYLQVVEENSKANVRYQNFIKAFRHTNAEPHDEMPNDFQY